MFFCRKSAAIMLCAMLLIAAAVQAQTVLSYGSAVTGSISTSGSSATFTFSGTAGDWVSARVINVTAGLETSLHLIAPDGSISGGDGSLTQRLGVSGDYLLRVTGENDQTGDFVLRLDAQIGISLPLNLGQVTRADFAVNGPPQVFNFGQNPAAQSLLTLSAADPTFRFSAAVRDSAGKLVAFFSPETRSLVLTIAAGSDQYNVSIAASNPTVAGLILIDLEMGDSVPPPAAQASVVTPPPVSQAEMPVYCHVSTNGSANIRSAPNTDADVLERLTRRKAVEVIGISADGAWYAVRLSTRIGWVAEAVAREIEPCVNLPVLSP